MYLLQLLTTPPPESGLSLGAWIGIVSTGLAVGTMLVKFGELKADTRNLRESTEKEVEEIRKGVKNELEGIKRQLEEVLTFIHSSQQQRVLDAGWQERTTANLTAAMKDAEQARETAHAAILAVTQGKQL